jgi:pimeloyl-ACP methyl ester carboxylesterase
MHKQDYHLITSDNEVIKITAYGDLANINRCIIYVHGFKGFKDWGFVPYLGEFLASKNFFVLTFNFSHNGIGENPLEFTENDKFARNTYSREISELSELVKAYLRNYFGKTGKSKIGLLGHSRGGAISILAATFIEEITAVVLWSSISRVDRYTKHQKEEWKKNKFYEVINKRTGQVMRLDISLLQDIEANSNTTLNILKAVAKFNKPLLIAHGEQDLTVPIKEAEELYEWSNKKFTKFIKIPSTGHTFDIKHPFEESNKKFDELLGKTYLFFEKNLN